MTPQEINEAVARKLGWTRPSYPHKIGDTPDYCRTIELAWEIVEHLCRLGHPPILWFSDNAEACVSFLYDEVVTDILPAPMAICLAFLELKEELKP